MWNFLPWWLLRKAVDTGSSLLDGLVSYWPLDEISGVRYDAVGSNDLTDNNTVGAVLRGPEGTVASFVKVNSEYLSLADSDAFTPSGSFSVSAWIYPTTSNIVFFVAKEETDPTSEWSLLTGAGGVLEGRFWGSGGLSQAVAPVGMNWVAANLNRWWLATYVYDADASTVTVYLNNDAGSPVATNGTLTNRAGALTIGGGARAAYEDNKMAGVGFWTRALSAGDIESLVASGNGLRYADLSDGLKTGLVSWWELDEVSGVRYDSHGSNDLTDNNTVGSVNSGPKGVVASMAEANTESLSNDDVSLDSVISYSMWFKRTEAANFGNYDGFITRGGTTRGLEIFGENGGSHFYWSVHLDNGTEINTIYTVPVNDTNWHLVSVWVDMVAQRAYFKMDGHAVESSAATVTSALEATPGAFTIGNWTYGGLDAHVGPVGAWTTAIGESVHDSLFNGGVGKRYADLTDGEKVGLVSFWNLDEQSGVRYDSHGTNHLTDNNTVGSVINAGAAMDGAAASFVAANSEILSKADFVAPDSYTFSAWVYAPTSIANMAIQQIIGLWPNNSQFTVYYGTTNTIYHLVGDGSTYSYSASALPDGADLSGRWINVVAWFDGVDKIPHVSVNGVVDLVATGAALAGTPYRVPTAFQLNGASGPSYSTIIVDEVAIWSRVLTADERAELYNLGRGKYYDFS